jgi:signal peptidase I
MGETTFEERLLPLLVEELEARPRELTTHRPRKVRTVASLIAVAVTAAVALAVLAGGSSDGIVTVTVASTSMLPTFKPGDTVAVDTNAYDSALPWRGDIIAFRQADFPDTVSLKRVIGLPGDSVEEVDGVVSVNGQVLDEPYADLDHTSGSWTVEEGHVFVLGDSRANSNDSRYTGEWGMGQVPIGDIIGKVLPEAVSGVPDVPAGPAPATAVSTVP